MRILPIVYSVFVIVSLMVSTAFAQSLQLEEAQPTEPVLRISPPTLDVEAAPGQTVTKTIIVENISDYYMPVKASALDFAATDDQGGLEFYGEERPQSAREWFSITPADMIIEPKGSRSVAIRIRVTANAEPGGRYVAAFFQPVLPAEFIPESNLAVQSQIGALFFVTVAGDVVKKASLSRFDVPTIARGTPFDIEIAVTSTGNVHVRPEGTITVASLRGKEVGKLATKEQGSLTALPGKTRALTVTWSKRLLPGIYRVQLDLADGVEVRLADTKTVIVFPYLLAIAVILIVLILLRTRGRWGKAWRILTE